MHEVQIISVEGLMESQGRKAGRRLRSKRPVFVLALLIATFWQNAPIDAAPCWSPPVDGEITDPYREPPCRWCAGNRGIEYSVAGSTAVRAAATGRVTFSGTVAGTLYVVVEIARGWRLTYGKLGSTHLGVGDSVVTGSVIGQSSGELFFGLRSGDTYLDPGPYLGRLVGRRRLVPIDGTASRPTTTHLQCQPRQRVR